MKLRVPVTLVLLSAAALAPVSAQDVALYAHRIDAVHVNVFRPLDGAALQTDGPEVSMAFGRLDVLVDPNEEGYPGEGGCIDIFNDGIVDSGCGPLTVEPDGVLGATRVHGTLETTAYRYDSETGFEHLGPSQIEVDLVATGEGVIEPSPYTNYAVGVCGLPPETRGVFVDGRPELQRGATLTGTLSSAYAGEVDPTPLPTLLVQAFTVIAGVCL